MISVGDAVAIHKILIQEFGGSHGLRDQNALEGALNRPYSSFDGKELYPTIIEKSAAILESIVIGHPFVDGNKRIGYVLMRLLLLSEGLEVNATQNQKYEFIIQITKGEIKAEEITQWIKRKVKI